MHDMLGKQSSSASAIMPAVVHSPVCAEHKHLVDTLSRIETDLKDFITEFREMKICARMAVLEREMATVYKFGYGIMATLTYLLIERLLR